ncbi:MAG: substrate-binding domain-containing protein [Burkholderiales bacterium]
MSSEEILSKLASWDLQEDAADGEGAALYNQLREYFTKFFAYFENISRISKQLNIVVQDFLTESSQVEQVAVFLKKGADRQMMDIGQSKKLVEDFTVKINAIYDKSQDIITLAYDMEKTNQSVSDSVKQLVLNQAKNDEAIRDINEVINNLINKTQRISDITNLINRISNETNLLGLNAKVEAVHAGAAGRGFAVVADEIQRLSNESKEASVNISDIIKSVTDEISHLESVALKSQDAFAAQRDTVNEVNNAIAKNSEFINTYISEQKSFNESIAAIKDDENILAESISNIFSSVREVSATAHEISSLTYNQNNSISLLSKLDADLSAGVASLGNESKAIKVRKVNAQRRKIAMIFDLEIGFWDPTKKEAIKAAETYNYDVDFFAPKTRGVSGIREMASFLDRIIEEKYDGLVISPIDDELIYQRLKRLNSIGTKIVFINSKIDNVDYVSLIQTEGLAAGAAAARVVIGAMGNQGEVIVNTWTDTYISAIDNRKNGFIQELGRNTNIKVHEVGVKSKLYDNEIERAVEAVLNAAPGARFIFLTNCEWGLYVAEYIKKHRSGIQVITIDFTKEIQQAMSEGYIHYAMGQRAYSWGSMAIDFIDKSFSGKQVKKFVDTGTYEVNRQNMNIYKSMLF